MRHMIAHGFVLVPLALSACSSAPVPAPPPSRPLAVGNGIGSQYGNYAAQTDGEMRGPSGERCVIFNWDRPLTDDLVIRRRSASCESTEHPGRMICVELSRTVIPLSESALKEEAESRVPVQTEATAEATRRP